MAYLQSCLVAYSNQFLLRQKFSFQIGRLPFLEIYSLAAESKTKWNIGPSLPDY